MAKPKNDKPHLHPFQKVDLLTVLHRRGGSRAVLEYIASAGIQSLKKLKTHLAALNLKYEISDEFSRAWENHVKEQNATEIKTKTKTKTKATTKAKAKAKATNKAPSATASKGKSKSESERGSGN